MEMVVEKAYYLFVSDKVDTPEQILGKMNTLSFAGRIELKNVVLWAKEQFDKWKMANTDNNL